MRAVAHNAASPGHTPCAAAEAAFAEAKAFLCSAEAQQMSESDLERELHRRGQELMRKLLQGHLDQRRLRKAAGPVEAADDVECTPHLQERLGGSRSSTVPRRNSTSRAPPCGNRHHPRSRVQGEDAVCVPSLHRRHRRVCWYVVRDRMESTGAGWRLVGGRVGRVDPEASGGYEPAGSSSLRCVLQLPLRVNTSAPHPAIR